LSFFNADWETVLNKVAKSAGATLVMDEVPPGRFSRYDRRDHSLSEAIRVLNRELEPKGFRLVEKGKGKFLDVMYLRSARAEYYRPELPEQQRTVAQNPYARPVYGFEPRKVKKQQRSVQTISARGSQVQPAGWQGQDRPISRNALASGWDRHTQEPGASARRLIPASRTSERVGAFPPLHAVEDTVIRVVATRNRPALEIARAIYAPLKSRAKLLTAGPSGLPAFQVFLPEPPRRPHSVQQTAGRAKTALFTIGIDSRRDELTVKATKTQCRDVVDLIQYLDAVEVRKGEVLRVVATKSSAARIAGALKPQLTLLAQAAQAQPKDQKQQPPPPKQEPVRQPGEFVFPPIRGRVVIREVGGNLVITGNQEDVEAVMQIIRQLDIQGLITAPNIKLHLLRHVNSQAMADLLTNVYRQLTSLRTGVVTGTTAQQPGSVGFIPVVRPNALLIIASKAELPKIEQLIDEELDRPVDPEKEYRVFHLKTAIASQVVANLNAFFTGAAAPGAAPGAAATATTGLATRVRLIADARTNTVIVEAAPNDMKVVANLIGKLDTDRPESVSRVRIFRLKNAVASELATLLNNAIQSVLNPPQVTGQAGQPGVGVGAGVGAGQGAQALRDVKSSILEFMVDETGRQRLVRSGILADIRITPDPRINAVVVTAPDMSMPLIAALIERLDSPSALVAEIKVFTLVNGDASAMLNLLQTLFPTQQPGAAPGATGQVGVQLIGADDASSGLIPLRFSVDPRTNSIIAVGGAGALNLVQAVILRLDERDTRQRQTTVVKLRNAPVTEVSTAINQFLTSQRNLYQIDPNIVTNLEILEREIIVVPEPVSNSLLISTTPRFYEEIRRMVEKLDAAPPQVVIQALLVEVELNNTDEFGVELGFQDTLLFDRGLESVIQTLDTTMQNASGVSTTSQQVVSATRTPGFNFVRAPLGQNTSANPSGVGTQGFGDFSLGRVNGDLGFGGLVLSAQSSSISVLLRALAAKRTVHVLSRPQITALDNQIAQIQVGQSVPVVQGTTTQTGVTTSNTAPQAVGIILTVTPRVRADGSIVMETVAEKSGLAGQGVPIFVDANTGNVVESPIINITTARTTVAVPNGQTIVLGGMITKSDDTLERKVPWLGDIPILKYAFRYDATTTRRTELLIFLTPRIVRDDADSEVIKQIEAERLHFIEKDAERLHGPLYSTPQVYGAPVVPAPLTGSATRTGRRIASVYDDPSIPTTDVPDPGYGLSDGVSRTSHRSTGSPPTVFVDRTKKQTLKPPVKKKSWFSWPW
jgi:type II secretion system protein D